MPVVDCHLATLRVPPHDIAHPVDADATGKPALLPKLREAVANGDQTGSEVDQVLVCLLPVQPGQHVVLAICVVVSGLGTAKFVAPLKHRDALGQEQRCEQRALQILSTMRYSRIVALAFDSAVPRMIVVVSVVVVLAVEFVVLVLIADEIAQGETVMGRDEIDTRQR